SCREVRCIGRGFCQITTPPLRGRRDDIPALAEHFLRQSRLPDIAEIRLGDDVLAELRARPWEGNIRELRNTIEHAAILARGGRIRREHLPAITRIPTTPMPAGREIQGQLAAWARQEVLASGPGPQDAKLYERFLELAEPAVLRTVLDHCQHNRAAAAQLLGIHRATLRQKCRKYSI